MNNIEDSRIRKLDIGSHDREEKHVTKEEIMSFFKSLNTMPTIDTEKVYEDILNDKINLPKFELETYFLNFCRYQDATKDMIIIQDFGSDTYYYIKDEQVLQCHRYEAQDIFYGEIATKTHQDPVDVHDILIDKLKAYETLFLEPQSVYISSLDDFIEENIYMFDAALKQKEDNNNKKVKMK